MSRFDSPAEERAFLFYYARVLVREAKARRAGSPGFAAFLLRGAVRARRQAFSIDVSPAQGALAL